MLREVRSFEIKWIYRPIRQIHPETGESLVFFQNTNPIIFVMLFIYYLNFCIKEGIKGNILDIKWKKCWPMRHLRPETGESLVIFSKHWSNCICFVYFSIFWLTLSKGETKELFLDIKFKSVGLWGSYGLKQGNPLQFF